MAIFGDKMQKLIALLAKLLHARDARFFHEAEVEKGWEWPKE